MPAIDSVAEPDTGQSRTASIDVVIPVYNAAADLRRCIDSVLEHTTAPYRLVLIDDASTDSDIAACFSELAQRALPHVELLVNASNLGFTGTANRAMLGSRADIVLLNSDTIVSSGWLDALARCAESDPSIGTVTPFSNNAEICSFPQFCRDNRWPDGADPEPVRSALARTAVPTYPDLPTGVGFCLYVRRKLIDAIGAFDPAFGRGYGEENDLCLRAASAGWRNVLCDDAFVLHVGSRSFDGEKAELGPRNLALILQRFPRYDEWVRAYIALDPLAPLRGAALSELRATGPAQGVMHVIHDHGGGTEHHARALIDASRARYRHYLAIAVGESWQVEEHLDDGGVRTFALRRGDDETWPDFIGGICATFRIGLVHLHNISGCRDGIAIALAELRIPYGYTVHDLSFACPTILFLGVDGNYCFQETDASICGACLHAQPKFAHIDIEVWRARHRALVAAAAFLIAPSRWAAAALRRYYPDHDVEIVPHAVPRGFATETSRNADAHPAAIAGAATLALPDDGIPAIAILGAVGPDKGARRLEKMCALVRATGARLRFVLIGYMDVEHGPWQSADHVLTVHGHYKPSELPGLLAHYRAALVAFPSAGPETFSFTLSEAWAAGLPVVVPPFGALAERVEGSGAGWSWSLDEWRDEAKMLARIADIVAPENAGALAAAAAQAPLVPRQDAATMAERTLRLYDARIRPLASTSRPLARSRVRDALGYSPWIPPRVEPPPAFLSVPQDIGDSPSVSGRTVADAAERLRPSLPARMLACLTPRRLRKAFRARQR